MFPQLVARLAGVFIAAQLLKDGFRQTTYVMTLTATILVGFDLYVTAFTTLYHSLSKYRFFFQIAHVGLLAYYVVTVLGTTGLSYLLYCLSHLTSYKLQYLVLQALYGEKSSVKPKGGVKPQTEEPPGSEEDAELCNDATVDTLFNSAEGVTYAFKGTQLCLFDTT